MLKCFKNDVPNFQVIHSLLWFFISRKYFDILFLLSLRFRHSFYGCAGCAALLHAHRSQVCSSTISRKQIMVRVRRSEFTSIRKNMNLTIRKTNTVGAHHNYLLTESSERIAIAFRICEWSFFLLLLSTPFRCAHRRQPSYRHNEKYNSFLAFSLCFFFCRLFVQNNNGLSLLNISYYGRVFGVQILLNIISSFPGENVIIN